MCLTLYGSLFLEQVEQYVLPRTVHHTGHPFIQHWSSHSLSQIIHVTWSHPGEAAAQRLQSATYAVYITARHLLTLCHIH